MPRRKRLRQLASPLQGGLTPLGHWIVDRIRGTSLTLPAVARFCDLPYPRFASIISGKLIAPYNFSSLLVEVFSCPEHSIALSNMNNSFKTSRSIAAKYRFKPLR